MWVKLDDHFYDNTKARRVGKDGRELYIAALCWAAGNLSDGFIRSTDLALVAAKAEVPGPATAKRLVEAGMWEVTDDGWLIHDYHDFNPSASAERKKRALRADAGRRGGEASAESKRRANGAGAPSKLLAVCLAFAALSVRAGPKQTGSKLEPRFRTRFRDLTPVFRVTQEVIHRQIRAAA